MKWKQDEYYKKHGKVEKWTMDLGRHSVTIARPIPKGGGGQWCIEGYDLVPPEPLGTADRLEAQAIVERMIQAELESMLKALKE